MEGLSSSTFQIEKMKSQLKYGKQKDAHIAF